jgi:hypothetical protein
MEWYPKKLNVGEGGNRGTVGQILKAFGPDTPFCYGELGIYRGATAEAILKARPRAHVVLFDYHVTLDAVRQRLAAYGDRVAYHGNTQKHLDNYNWGLMKLISENDYRPMFDYFFLDGAHTFAVDALSFFLCDRLLNVGGYMDFDDYNWRLRGSSLDPRKVPVTAEQYTDEQINTKQVQMIVDHLVKPDPRYKEVRRNKIYRKIA